MKNILETILIQKRKEIETGKKRFPTQYFEKQVLFSKDPHSLKAAIKTKKRKAVIAEFKTKSPSAGVINKDATVETVLPSYAKCGAAGLSVLTDEVFFGGNLRDLQKGVETGVPLLRKDFIIDKWQLFEAKASGADAILLIAACLSPMEVKGLVALAKTIGLEVVLELHKETEMAHLCSDVDIVGVNNRNLGNFSVNLEHSVNMAEKLGSNILKIAESGISSAGDAVFLGEHGFDGFLIGSLFMQEKDPGKAFCNFIKALNQLYGN
jgi:indole-3-glycerol phosphate synthase